MKQDIHPKWFPDATVVCACGNTWQTGATQAEIRTDICSACHPFYTGEQRIVDTEGQVDRFMKRLQVRDNIRNEQEAREASKTPLDLSMVDLGLDKRAITVLKEGNIEVVSDLLDMLKDGDDKLLALPGVGQKILADVKKLLRARGYDVPAGNEAE